MHTGDRTLGALAFVTAGWAVQGGKGSFSQFRAIATGPDNSGGIYLMCAGLELYGALLPGSGTQ